MGLLGPRQIHGVNVDFQNPFAGERGGVLTVGTYSGVYMAAYHNDPSGKMPVGVMLHDVESLDLSREYNPGGMGRGQREVSQPLDIIQALTEGEIITDFIDPTYNDIRPGTPAYVGPSGLITDKSSYGGWRIGYFLSNVNSSFQGFPAHETNQVIVLGGGLNTTVLSNDPNHPGKTEVLNPFTVRTNVAGWAKVRINIRGGVW